MTRPTKDEIRDLLHEEFTAKNQEDHIETGWIKYEEAVKERDDLKAKVAVYEAADEVRKLNIPVPERLMADLIWANTGTQSKICRLAEQVETLTKERDSLFVDSSRAHSRLLIETERAEKAEARVAKLREALISIRSNNLELHYCATDDEPWSRLAAAEALAEDDKPHDGDGDAD